MTSVARLIGSIAALAREAQATNERWLSRARGSGGRMIGRVRGKHVFEAWREQDRWLLSPPRAGNRATKTADLRVLYELAPSFDEVDRRERELRVEVLSSFEVRRVGADRFRAELERGRVLELDGRRGRIERLALDGAAYPLIDKRLPLGPVLELFEAVGRAMSSTSAEGRSRPVDPSSPIGRLLVDVLAPLDELHAVAAERVLAPHHELASLELRALMQIAQDGAPARAEDDDWGQVDLLGTLEYDRGPVLRVRALIPDIVGPGHALYERFGSWLRSSATVAAMAGDDSPGELRDFLESARADTSFYRLDGADWDLILARGVLDSVPTEAAWVAKLDVDDYPDVRVRGAKHWRLLERKPADALWSAGLNWAELHTPRLAHAALRYANLAAAIGRGFGA